MKISSILPLFLFASLSAATYGANLAFPVSASVVNGSALGPDWTQSDGALAADKLAFYATIPDSGSPLQYSGVSVGAYYDDYTTVGPDFSISHATDTVGVSSSVLDWHFAIKAPSASFPALNNYSINLTATNSSNLLTIDLSNVSPTQWSASANGNFFGVVESGGLYALHADFGASTGLHTSITSPDNTTISYTDVLFATTGKTFGTVGIGTTKGASLTFGDGILTVVPEPGTTMLFSLLPAFVILRRRR